MEFLGGSAGYHWRDDEEDDVTRCECGIRLSTDAEIEGGMCDSCARKALDDDDLSLRKENADLKAQILIKNTAEARLAAKLKRVVDKQQTEIEGLTANIVKARELQEAGSWLWLEGEENDLESMSDIMVVRIHAGVLRRLIEETEKRVHVAHAPAQSMDEAYAILRERGIVEGGEG